MRLWHKDLIPVLPRQQLLGQWRECCLIAKNIKEKGTPNHLLVNRIMDYPAEHFVTYCYQIFKEMNCRDYNVHSSKLEQYLSLPFCKLIDFDDLFDGWHNDRYLYQCLSNLQEKFDCGGIGICEYEKIMEFTNEHFKE